MTSDVRTKNCSSFADKNNDPYAFNNLAQLAQETNIVKIERDDVSSLKKVVLNNGPFQCNSSSYLNDIVKYSLVVNSQPIKSQNFPVF